MCLCVCVSVHVCVCCSCFCNWYSCFPTATATVCYCLGIVLSWKTCDVRTRCYLCQHHACSVLLFCGGVVLLQLILKNSPQTLPSFLCRLVRKRLHYFTHVTGMSCTVLSSEKWRTLSQTKFTCASVTMTTAPVSMTTTTPAKRTQKKRGHWKGGFWYSVWLV